MLTPGWLQEQLLVGPDGMGDQKGVHSSAGAAAACDTQDAWGQALGYCLSDCSHHSGDLDMEWQSGRKRSLPLCLLSHLMQTLSNCQSTSAAGEPYLQGG